MRFKTYLGLLEGTRNFNGPADFLLSLTTGTRSRSSSSVVEGLSKLTNAGADILLSGMTLGASSISLITSQNLQAWASAI